MSNFSFKKEVADQLNLLFLGLFPYFWFFFLIFAKTKMKIVNRHILDACITKHASSKKAMGKFAENLIDFEGTNHNELLAAFPNADYVGEDRYVFDIKGGRFRTICIIVFINDSASFRFAGTHAEYNKINASKI